MPLPIQTNYIIKRMLITYLSCHVIMSSSTETEQSNRISFLDNNAIHEQGKLTSVYRKPTFSGVYTHFDSFFPNTYKIGMIYALVNKCYAITGQCFIHY